MVSYTTTKGKEMEILNEFEVAMEFHRSLMSALDTAKSNANQQYELLKSIDTQLGYILKCKLSSVGEIPIHNLDATNLKDEDYLSELQKIYAKYPYEMKLKSIVFLIEKLKAYSETLKVKRLKLNSRIKLAEAGTEESKTAHRLYKSVTESMLAAGSRCDHLVKMFFDYRRAMLNYIMGNTEMLVRLFTEDGEVSPNFREYYNKRVKAESFHNDHEAMNGKMKRRILK
jgi:hypothetical protein